MTTDHPSAQAPSGHTTPGIEGSAQAATRTGRLETVEGYGPTAPFYDLLAGPW